MTNEHIAARLREIASNLPNVADSEPICSALHGIATELEAQPAGDAGMPPRDPTKTNEQQGLFRKFIVRRTDGSDAPGGKHHGCDYFVLDVTHDRHAKAALAAYADAVEATHPLLSANMRTRWGLAAGDAGMPVVAAEYPAGAIENGREHARRLENYYQFNCEAGPLRLCEDFHGLMRCFEHLAGWCGDAQAATSARDARIAELEADTRMLDWMIDHGASVISGENTGDGKCRVSYYHGCGGCPVCGPAADTPRDAIAAAMQEDAK